MEDDHDWIWSPEFKDYYKYRRRNVPGKALYDLIWGRSMLSHDEQKPSSPPASVVDQRGINPTLPISSRINDRDIPYQLSTHNFPNISEIQEQYTAPQIIKLDPTPRLNNSSLPLFYQRLEQRLDPEDVSFTTGPRTNTPTTSVGTPRHSFPGPGSEQGISRYDDDSVRTASPIDPQVISRTSTLSISPDISFESIRNPRAYFKKGRVFKVNWPEPKGELGSTAALPALSNRADAVSSLSIPQTNGAFDTTHGLDGTTGSTPLYVKRRIFIVIRQRALHCLCLPVYTYSQQGTSKTGVKPEDHAPLIREHTDLELHPDEQPGKLKKTIYLISEDPTLQWSPLSRINLSKVQSVEYNLKVKTVGRVSPDCLADLEALFREAIGLSED